ncbi:TniQ family protein [Paenibacillus oryzisoli]|uniref:HTH cro/C1-type domain-containing protein n=1 Tax=Paenibacillus oryzisoli TaxID=1850517 RepID=A0A197ZX58_9BACL|nr:TniQ family protein [Paenibacillus oryzisoli]OAS13749.1 hypothetical protein A8708_25245 [Paenibacillus oryzisoli]
MENQQELSPIKSNVSVLYRLEPIGINTGQCEGLTGYLTRLAQEHQVLPHTLIKHVVAPLLGKKYLLQDLNRGGSRFFERSISINGVGEFSQEIVEALHDLTTFASLEQLTLLPWKKVIVNKYLLNQSKAWCSFCFEYWKTSNKPLYEPLIWSFRDMAVCPIHNILLDNKCPNPQCGNRVPFLKRNSIIGYCPFCLTWLGIHGTNQKINVCWEKLLWVSNSLYKLVETNHYITHKQLSEQNLQKSFLRLLSTTGYNMNQLAKELTLHKSNVWQYCNGTFIPPLHTILMICFHFNISLVDFLTDTEFSPTFRDVPVIHYANKLRNQKIKIEEIKTKIKLLQKVSPPLSLQELSRRLGYTTKTLKKNFPDLTSQIKHQHSSFKSIYAKQKTENTCQDLRNTIQDLLNQGIYPSRKRVEDHLKRPGILQKPIYKSIWRELRK